MAGSRRRHDVEEGEIEANGGYSEGKSRERDKERDRDREKDQGRERRADRDLGEREKDRRRSDGHHDDGDREDRDRDRDRGRDRHSGERERNRERGERQHREKRQSNGRHDEEDDSDGIPRRSSRSRRDRDRNRDGGDRSRREKEDREGRRREREKEDEREEALPPPPPLPPLPDAVANAGRSGGVYIPPFKMAQMMRDVQDKSSEAYQRLSWDALRKSINGLVNKVNAANIKNIIPELFSENLIRGRGLFCRSCMKSQMASPGFTDVFAALVAVVNTKFPEVGKLLLQRIVLQLKRAYKRNDKPQLLAATKFIAHLVNQQVAHEIIALELLTVLLENPTDDSVEVAVGFVKECGSLLQDISPQGLHGIFERFRGILHEGEIDKRVQFLIEGLFAIRKAKFQGFPAVRPELDLVEVEDQFTHEISLEDEIDPETVLDIFKPNPQFLEDEKAYENLKKSILGDDSSEDEEGSEAASDDEDENENEDEDEEEDDEQMKIKDETETNLVNLRRTIYLTIMSSVDFEEAGHKLLKIKLEPGQEQYSMIHRLETNKLRNVAKFFAHLLGTDALPWHVLAYIRLTEEDTTASSRIFIKILFQELSEHLGIRLLNERLTDPTMQDSFESIFPRDNPKNTRFAINFFTSIGLGGITENLREYLKNMPRLIMQQQKPVSESDDESGSSGSSSSGSSSTESESESESASESERHVKRRRRG
ncbi:hypothetical protein Taro_006148 [Colocasia esculenta]|uniref:MIF4G domain-containing protein n=1 Tax=Colocasia esculenta TaxID=4460 RepID=A0A843TV76_COLES|nr:hypothetical protein [Colocasia esculenta]